MTVVKELVHIFSLDPLQVHQTSRSLPDSNPGHALKTCQKIGMVNILQGKCTRVVLSYSLPLPLPLRT